MSLSPSTRDFPEEDAEIHITEFTSEDAPELAQLMALVWPQATHIPREWRQRRILSQEDIIDEMKQGFHYFGARLEGQIAGFYKTFLKAEGLIGEHQTVHPNFRHRGLVRAMYRQFITYAEELDAPANICNILFNHDTMRALVESFGFQPEGDSYEQAPGMRVQLYKRPR
jgi:hypothetical protein